MSKTTFKANRRSLEELLKLCHTGGIQLPDFQRSWVWGEDRILSLIASISRAFPVGALMSLESKKGEASLFARRRIQGAPSGDDPDELLLHGQQRMTSLYQACYLREVVHTITPKNKMVKRWFYINIREALTGCIARIKPFLVGKFASPTFITNGKSGYCCLLLTSATATHSTSL